MIFDWDENKNAANLRKHGVAFEDAVLVFDDPFHISLPDRIVEGEQRWQMIGMAEGVLVLLLAHTLETNDEDQYVRLISARKAEPHERRRYEAGE
ncbi:hypothetical protein SAMN05421819_0596 [Bryocella elongata]|uniref:Uncharacterized protein n=1 Tax=Bryocella elongata TaxID=863522 RepID=A0A1H5TI85_9BACT|nr:BrnT family toxin [Bryocella elongata]SEF61717.1 hypothetical protein SAMN05421819_0596 [Bryocella elongata]